MHILSLYRICSFSSCLGEAKSTECVVRASARTRARAALSGLRAASKVRVDSTSIFRVPCTRTWSDLSTQIQPSWPSFPTVFGSILKLASRRKQLAHIILRMSARA